MEKKEHAPLKLCIFKKEPMSEDGYKRWGYKQRTHISKSKWVRKFFESTKDKFPDGVPLVYLQTDSALANWLIDNFIVSENVEYQIVGFSHGKTKTHVKFSKVLARIVVHNIELHKFTVWDSGNFNRYGFRRDLKKTHR